MKGLPRSTADQVEVGNGAYVMCQAIQLFASPAVLGGCEVSAEQADGWIDHRLGAGNLDGLEGQGAEGLKDTDKN